MMHGPERPGSLARGPATLKHARELYEEERVQLKWRNQSMRAVRFVALPTTMQRS